MISYLLIQVASSHFLEETFAYKLQIHKELLSRNQLEDLLFETCPECLQRMSSLPQGAFAARKVRENMGKCAGLEHSYLVTSRIKEADKTGCQYPLINKKFLEHPPAKYNNKFMNSIWGLYNRYSVHNLKKITEGDNTFFTGEQQCYAVATPTSSNTNSGSKGNSAQGAASLDTFWIGNTY